MKPVYVSGIGYGSFIQNMLNKLMRKIRRQGNALGAHAIQNANPGM